MGGVSENIDIYSLEEHKRGGWVILHYYTFLLAF